MTGNVRFFIHDEERKDTDRLIANIDLVQMGLTQYGHANNTEDLIYEIGILLACRAMITVRAEFIKLVEPSRSVSRDRSYVKQLVYDVTNKYPHPESCIRYSRVAFAENRTDYDHAYVIFLDGHDGGTLVYADTEQDALEELVDWAENHAPGLLIAKEDEHEYLDENGETVDTIIAGNHGRMVSSANMVIKKVY